MLSVLLITACNSNKTEENKPAEIPKEELVTFVELTKEQFEAVDIQLGKIEKQNIKTSIKASGHLEVPPQNKAEVSTFIGAVVKSIAVLEGSKVQKDKGLQFLNILILSNCRKNTSPPKAISLFSNRNFFGKRIV